LRVRLLRKLRGGERGRSLTYRQRRTHLPGCREGPGWCEERSSGCAGLGGTRCADVFRTPRACNWFRVTATAGPKHTQPRSQREIRTHFLVHWSDPVLDKLSKRTARTDFRNEDSEELRPGTAHSEGCGSVSACDGSPPFRFRTRPDTSRWLFEGFSASLDGLVPPSWRQLAETCGIIYTPTLPTSARIHAEERQTEESPPPCAEAHGRSAARLGPRQLRGSCR
jgi:hypothetical protein